MRVRTGGLLALLVAVLGSVGAFAGAAPAPGPGRHFVLLLDDSGDMGGQAQTMRQVLPALLFGDDADRTVGWAPFDPRRDTLTPLFFTIHVHGPADSCKSLRRFSTLPEAVLQPVEIAPGELDAERFRGALGSWLDRPCRFGGKFSPIVTATTLSLPFVAASVRGQAFSETLVLVVTNDVYNTTTSPAFELPNLPRSRDGAELGDVEATLERSEEVLRTFGFELPAGWSHVGPGPGRRLVVRTFRVVPRTASPAALVVPPPAVRLDRVAVSPREVAWHGVREDGGLLRLYRDGGLSPVRLAWRIDDGEGGAWRLGDDAVPTTWHELDLAACGAPCRQEDEVTLVSLGDLLDLPTMTPEAPVPAQDGRLDLRVELRYDSGGVYDALHPVVRLHLPLHLSQVRGSGRFLLSPDVELDNQALSELWRRGDGGGLTQAAALDRLLQHRVRFYVVCALLAVATVAGLVYLLFRRFYERAFDPSLDWRPAGPVAVDLAHDGGGRLLLGTVGVRNRARQPWFGRLLGHDEQPTRPVDLEVPPVDLAGLGFRLIDGPGPAVGFLASEEGDDGADDALAASIRRSVSHGQRVPMFLAGEAFGDFVPGEEAVEERTVEVESSARLSLLNGHAVPPPVITPAGFEIRVLPQPASPPRVRFQAAPGRLEYRHGEDVEVGAFVFTSTAGRRFARPFEATYDLEILVDRMPLGGRAFRLARPTVRLDSGEQIRVPVLLRGDGETVVNPEPSERSYGIVLLGPCHPDSRCGPHEVVLHRDSARAEAEIRVSYLGRELDLYRSEAGGVEMRCGDEGRSVEAVDGVLELPGEYRLRIPPEAGRAQAPTLLSLRVGNSGRSGRGRVTVEVGRRLDLSDHAAACLHLEASTAPDELLVCYDEGEEVRFPKPGRLPIEVAEGEDEVRRLFKLAGAPVRRIDGARLGPDDVRAVVELRVHVVDDRGEERQWQVDLEARVAMEKLPGLNWLCVDFGTSAIAVAVGRADGDVFHRVDLQSLEVAAGRSVASVDSINPEQRTPFLPSWIACDGDLRHAGPQDDVAWPAGFPLHHPSSLELRDPAFVSLPAIHPAIGERSGRLVLWLKQRLGRLASSLRLEPAVRFRLDGRETTSHLVPLDEVLEATLGALFHCYLARLPHARADQVVLTHPNTFSARHRERFRAIACRALLRHGVVAVEEHVALLSESDAVAYAYCVDKMTGAAVANPRRGSERILVYDFGAGTLDLSLLQVEWGEERNQPRSWIVEGRLGLPLAGNHVDEILARLIDERLREDSVLNATGCVYEYPLVGQRVDRGKAEVHREAVLSTWAELRQAKHAWDGSEPFDVVVGDQSGRGGVVVRGPDQLSLADLPPAGRCGLYLAQGQIRLSIPAAEIHDDRRLREYRELVTVTAIEELLAQAGVDPQGVDTLLVSGRGALFPGLQAAVEAELPAAHVVEPGDALSRKDVVSRGAIAFQALRHRLAVRHSDRARQPLAILLGRRELVPEDLWSGGRPVDVSGCEEIRLVQVGLRRPQPGQDLDSLRRHFYVDVTEAPIRTGTLWRDDPRLFVDVEERGERLRISLRNAGGQSIDLDPDAVAAAAPVDVPWPVGSFLLPPEEESR